MRSARVGFIGVRLAILAAVCLLGFRATTAEAQDSGDATSPGNFRLLSAATHKASANFRFNIATGETWVADTDNAAWYWQKLTEDGSIPAGDYIVKARAYVENKAPAVVLMRMEGKTGQLWFSGANNWTSMPEPDTAPTPCAAGFRLVMANSLTGWNGCRLNPQTGESWTLNDSGLKLQKISDSQPPPAGDYDLQPMSFLNNGKPTNFAMRLERKTGQAWVTNDTLTLWQPIGEAAGAAAPAASPSGFKLIMSSTKISWVAFRANPATGEAWGISVGPSGPFWQKVGDANPPAAGNYQFDITSFIQNNKGVPMLCRINRATGQGWGISGGAWTAIAEAAGAGTIPVSKLGYSLVLSTNGTIWGAARCNPETGAVWMLDISSGTPAWKLTPDSPALSPGYYQFKAAAYTDNNAPSEIAFKIDRNTGWLWISTDLATWQSVAEDSMFPKPPLPKNGFRLVAGASKVSWDAYRYNPESGETWHPFYQGVAFIDEFLSEPATIPSGQYDVQMTSTAQNNVGSASLLRLNRQNGASWHKVDSAWQAIAETAPAPAAKSQ